MKHLSLLVAGLIAASPILSTPSAADGATTFIPAQTDTEYLAKDHLIGAKVHGKDGTIVADVEDLIVNGDNQIVGVVIGTGGYLGFAEKKIAVTLASLKFEEKEGAIYVSLPDAAKETLGAAPEFQRKKPAKSLFERAAEKVNELKDKTTSSTEDAYEKAKPAIEDAKQKAGEAYEKAKEAVSGAVDKTKEAVDEATKPADATPPAEPAPATPAP